MDKPVQRESEGEREGKSGWEEEEECAGGREGRGGERERNGPWRAATAAAKKEVITHCFGRAGDRDKRGEVG